MTDSDTRTATQDVVESTPFGSTDETRLVTPRQVELCAAPRCLQLAGGNEFGPIQVTYETYGQLSPEKDNAFFICHALTGDAHAAGRHSLDDRKPGWWDDFIGPGRGIDTDRYFVICANVLGGCQGTTGPSSINPETGEPYGLTFPFITIADIVRVHRELVAHLGIERLAGIIGGSLGGMQVLEWIAQDPENIDKAIVLASAANLSAQGIAFNAVGRRAIYADPQFRNGEYYSTGNVEATVDAENALSADSGIRNKPGTGPRFGLALARMIAHITYLSESSIEKKFGRRLQDSDHLAFDLMRETEFQIESYLHYQGKQFVERFDANSYLYLTKAMDYFDMRETYGSLQQALKRSTAEILVASYTTDWLFPSSQSRDLVSALISAGRHASFCELTSPYGHDAFLIEINQLTELVRAFLAG
ncbi:homoserine O-acetyltransferase family protein [Rubinisphaera margarita]|uniref:homoserine O-acetyltransferase family protein n=1 Tax=Rubinisphaera margarita TaxID=2909586 RepID=UPI001EE8F8B4|nr:homoserine O-acetyltransferase [Rubinisphaera margarita]MCG6156995.1 homoserine O-acetyltransferase [Rubinisphaera margarita]